ncbi:MAG: ankyrin repeat domain-containing protein [Candidatus Babeliales bacterium]
MNSFISILLTVMCVSSINAQESQIVSPCDLGTVLYNVTKHFGRNDWLYLAHANAMWYAHKKLCLQEYVADLDKYYLRFACTIDGIHYDVYRTPLHEAIHEANVAMVKFLCASGADKNKVVKGVADIEANECSTERYPVVGFIAWREGNADKTFCMPADDTIGLSAVALAQKLSTKTDEVPAVLDLSKQIYAILSKDE